MILALVLAASAADVTAQAFITEVREGHTDTVAAALSDQMKAAISAGGLISAWKQATASLGAFSTLEQTKAFEKSGLQGFVFAAKFARGALEVTTAVNPLNSKIEGFFMKPLPMPLVTPGPVKAAEYVKGNLFSATEISVGKAPFVLGGTLALPKGKGPFPAVVLVHGSGPNDRDETLGANKPFKDLAEGLASSGVVVVRYDKRTLTYGAKYAGKEITFDEEIIDDARAAIDLLKTRPEVDPKRIYVVGHSLGALFAPAVAAKGKGVAGLALLAPSSRKPWEIIPQQMRYLGVPEAQVATIEKAFAEVKSGKAKGFVLNAPASYWKAWASFDGPALAKSLAIPVLVLHGTRDYQVIDADIEGWKKGLAGAKSAELTELPGLNHLFIAGEGTPSPKEYEFPGHVAPEVIARLVAFCR